MSKLRMFGLVCAPLALFACSDENDSCTVKTNGDGTQTISCPDGSSAPLGNPQGAATATTGDSTSSGGTTSSTAASTSDSTADSTADTTSTTGGAGAPGVLDVGARVINLTPARFFPEGAAIAKDGTFYIGSMDTSAIHSAKADDGEAAPFIEPDATNLLVSVIGLYVDDASDTLYVCSSDAGNNNSPNVGAQAAVVAFSLPDGAFVARYEIPAYSGGPWTGMADSGVPDGINGFCNDMTMDADGNLYMTDSWYPRILRLPAGGDALEEWVVDAATFPSADPWHLNGIDIDQSTNVMYVVENHPGALYSIPIMGDGTPGPVTPIAVTRTDAVATTDTTILSPDGLKVAAPNLLITAEGGNNGGDVAVIRVAGSTAEIAEVVSGFDQVATLALHQASAWVVENQGDHFWGAADNGPDANPPFRLVEVPLDVGGGAGIIETATPNFFSEGVTVDASNNFYVGSMKLGSIERAALGDAASAEFVAPDADNGLVSVLGLYADDDNDTLWACASDASAGGNVDPSDTAIVEFVLSTGAFVARYEWPEYSGMAEFDTAGYGATGFCNDITVDADGNLYATDSWYPRILTLPADGDELVEWVVDDAVFPSADAWHLNGIDIDPSTNTLYAVENHPGAVYAVPIEDGAAGTPIEIATQRPVYSPDGLKVIGDNLLAIAEGQPGGMATIELDGDGGGYVRRISTGLDGIATFAVVDGSAWLVENQGDHFWGGDGMETKPFRLVEVPLNQ